MRFPFSISSHHVHVYNYTCARVSTDIFVGWKGKKQKDLKNEWRSPFFKLEHIVDRFYYTHNIKVQNVQTYNSLNLFKKCTHLSSLRLWKVEGVNALSFSPSLGRPCTCDTFWDYYFYERQSANCLLHFYQVSSPFYTNTEKLIQSPERFWRNRFSINALQYFRYVLLNGLFMFYIFFAKKVV